MLTKRMILDVKDSNNHYVQWGPFSDKECEAAITEYLLRAGIPYGQIPEMSAELLKSCGSSMSVNGWVLTVTPLEDVDYITVDIEFPYGKLMSGAVTREKGEAFVANHLIGAGLPAEEISDYAAKVAHVSNEPLTLIIGDRVIKAQLCER